MKNKYIYSWLFSLYLGLCFAQDSIVVKDSNTLITTALPNQLIPAEKGIFIGVDLLRMAQKIWDPGYGVEAYINMPVYKKWHGAAEIGYHKDTYTKAGWNAKMDGIYLKVGTNYAFKRMSYNANDMVYMGLRIAYGRYTQLVNQYRISYINLNGNASFLSVNESLPEANLTAFWLEYVIGARTAIAKTNFYLDTHLNPKYLITASKQNDNIDPLLIPGFGKDINHANLSFSITLGYKIPISNKNNKAKKNIKSA